MGTTLGLQALLAMAETSLSDLLPLGILSYLFASTLLVVCVGWREHRSPHHRP